MHIIFISAIAYTPAEALSNLAEKITDIQKQQEKNTGRASEFVWNVSNVQMYTYPDTQVTNRMHHCAYVTVNHNYYPKK